MKIKPFFFPLLVLLVTAGCGDSVELTTTGANAMPAFTPTKNIPAVKQLKIPALADQLVSFDRGEPKFEEGASGRRLKKPPVGVREARERDNVIIVTTFLNANNYKKSSKLGRILSEGLISELHKRGFTVIEFHLRESVQLVEKTGDLGITREAAKIARDRKASYVLTGTYADAVNSVYINARLVDVESAALVSVATSEVEKSKEIEYLVADDPDEGEAPSRRDPVKPSAYE